MKIKWEREWNDYITICDDAADRDPFRYLCLSNKDIVDLFKEWLEASYDGTKIRVKVVKGAIFFQNKMFSKGIKIKKEMQE